MKQKTNDDLTNRNKTKLNIPAIRPEKDANNDTAAGLTIFELSIKITISSRIKYNSPRSSLLIVEASLLCFGTVNNAY